MTTERVVLPLVPDTDEIFRYLGYRGNLPDPSVQERVREIVDELGRGITPGFVYSCYPLTVEDASDGNDPDGIPVLRFAGMDVCSRDLFRNLQGCRRVIAFAATLGPWPDRLQQRVTLKSMRDAVIVQACAAAMIEALCDQKNEELRQRAEKDGWRLKPRFSPGYGDLSLGIQKDLIQLLDATRSIGLSLTDSLMMVPTKSVTALIGLYPGTDVNETDPAGSGCHEDGSSCDSCRMRKTCGFRRG